MKSGFRASALFLALLFVIASCGSSEPETDDPDERVCPDGLCSFGDVEGAYHGTHSQLFCFAEEARGVVVEEDIDLDELVSDLPEWASTEYRDGIPVIVDISTTRPNDGATRADQIQEALEHQGSLVKRGEGMECMDEVDQEMIEDSEGPYRGPIEWSRPEE